MLDVKLDLSYRSIKGPLDLGEDGTDLGGEDDIHVCSVLWIVQDAFKNVI